MCIRDSDNACQAKERALKEAHNTACRCLAEKLCFSADQKRAFESLVNESDVVRSLKFCNERSSGNMFQATVRFYYDPERVQSIWADERIPFTLRSPRHCVVLILTEGDASKEDFENVWNNQSNPNSLSFRKVVDGFKELLLWRQYKETEDVSELVQHYASAYPDDLIVLLRYKANTLMRGELTACDARTQEVIFQTFYDKSSLIKQTKQHTNMLEDLSLIHI